MIAQSGDRGEAAPPRSAPRSQAIGYPGGNVGLRAADLPAIMQFMNESVRTTTSTKTVTGISIKGITITGLPAGVGVRD